MKWVSVTSELPKLFERVLVYGVVPRQNVCAQIWEARRWSGCNWGVDLPAADPERTWDWLTPTDSTVTDVTHWAPLPEFPQRGDTK